jgi:hypothetical protein
MYLRTAQAKTHNLYECILERKKYLLALGKKGYVEQGRGVVIMKIGGEEFFISIEQLREADPVLPLVRQYDPTCEVVLVVLMEQPEAYVYKLVEQEPQVVFIPG